MSVRVWSLCWRVPVGGNTKLVLLRLADFANDTGGSIFPTIATVAEDCGISERTVQYCLRELEEAKLIVPSRGPKTGRGYVTSYRIDMNRVNETIRPAREWEQTENIEINKGANSAPFDAPMGAKNDEKGANSSEKGASLAPDPSLTVKNPPPPVAQTDSSQNRIGGGGSDIQRVIAEFDRLLESCFGDVAKRERVARCDPGFAGKWIEMVGGSVEAVVDALGTVVERESLKPNGKIPGSLAMFQDSILPELRAYGTESTRTATDLKRNGHGRSNGTISNIPSPGGDLWKKVFQDARQNGLKEIEERIKALVTAGDIATANDFARSVEAIVAGKKARAAA